MDAGLRRRLVERIEKYGPALLDEKPLRATINMLKKGDSTIRGDVQAHRVFRGLWNEVTR